MYFLTSYSTTIVNNEKIPIIISIEGYDLSAAHTYIVTPPSPPNMKNTNSNTKKKKLEKINKPKPHYTPRPLPAARFP